MSLFLPNQGIVRLLDVLRLNWGQLKVGLFLADRDPGDADTVADYQAMEASFPGYARQNLVSWTPALLIVDEFARTEADFVTWVRGMGAGSQTIFGYFVVDPGGGLLWAENRPFAPMVMDTVGQTLTFMPRFALEPSP